MKKLEGKVAVITGATTGMGLETARLFVKEGAYVFITGRRQETLDQAVKEIGKNVTGVQGDSGSLADLDRLFESVKETLKERGLGRKALPEGSDRRYCLAHEPRQSIV
jgi:NAD(P)-dependent dehydrogenase (short-subunit alcohol dehydrogenase family)